MFYLSNCRFFDLNDDYDLFLFGGPEKECFRTKILYLEPNDDSCNEEQFIPPCASLEKLIIYFPKFDVESLESSVKSLESDMESLESDIGILKSDVDKKPKFCNMDLSDCERLTDM